MSDHCIIQASFADHKRIKTRSVTQLIIEIPIEDTMRVLSILGDPMPGEEIPVAVARLQNEIQSTNIIPVSSGKGGGVDDHSDLLNHHVPTDYIEPDPFV